MDGVIGSDHLKHFPVSIEYRASRIVFETAQSLAERRRRGAAARLELENETTPYLHVCLNGNVRSRYKLDTGAGATYLRRVDMEALGLTPDSPLVETIEQTSLAGSYTSWRTRLDSFTVITGAGGSACITETPHPAFGEDGITIRGMTVLAYETTFGFIGASFLQNFVVTPDYSAGECIFSPPED